MRVNMGDRGQACLSAFIRGCVLRTRGLAITSPSDTVRMNNIAAHFVTAFLDLHLKGEAAKAAYLTAEFMGLAEGTARGLRWETLPDDGQIAHPTPGSGQ